MTSPTDTARRDGFQTLLQQHRGIVAKVAGTYAWHPDDRDDLMQEIATQLWRAWPGYDPQRPVATWMYRIALNVAISHVRSAGQRAPHVPLDEPEIERLQQALATAAKPLQRYRCAACGFESQHHFWQCPGCHGWDTYPPRRLEEQ